MNKKSVLGVAGSFLIALGGILGLPFPAFADYVAFQSKVALPCDTTNGDCTMQGISGDGTTFMFQYTATGTVVQLDRIDLAICRTGGSGSGFIDLQVRTTATTGPIVASSTLSVLGNVWSSQCNNPPSATAGNGTTSTWVLNNKIQWLCGVDLFFQFKLRSVDGSDTFKVTAFPGSANQYYYTGTTPSTSCGPSGTSACSVFVIGHSLGSAPPGGIVAYDASTTAAVCNTFDVGCYFSSALAWAFYPDGSLLDQFTTLKDDIKNKPPFGYFTSAYTAAIGFSTSSSPAFLLATSSPITTYIFAPLRSGLTWLILLAGVYWLYRRLTEIQI
jgi:hypothetical protein